MIDPRKQVSKIKNRSISKKHSTSSHVLTKGNPPNCKIINKKSSSSQSYLSSKKYSPYKEKLKTYTAYLDNCNHAQNIKKFENKPHNLKKVGKNSQKIHIFCRK